MAGKGVAGDGAFMEYHEVRIGCSSVLFYHGEIVVLISAAVFELYSGDFHATKVGWDPKLKLYNSDSKNYSPGENYHANKSSVSGRSAF